MEFLKDKEFKKALSHLPNAEKDKLILRLLKKDESLAKRLFFELSDDYSVEERRNKLERYIVDTMEKMANRFYVIGYLSMDVRYLSGTINEHVKITKDKYGDASLNLVLLIETLKQNKDNLKNSKAKIKLTRFYSAIISRIFKVLLLINKMDEDLRFDFNENLEDLGGLIGDNHKLMKLCINVGLDVNWLIDGEIPSDIVSIHKELKANGFL
jgi:hypothetical protein